MELKNIKEVKLWFENVITCTMKTDVIKSFEINEYQHHIGKDLAYKVKVVLDINAKADFSIPEGYKPPFMIDSNDEIYASPIRRLNMCDDIVGIMIEYLDGTKAQIKPYWGDYDTTDYSLYQRSYYEVNNKNELTGNYILEFYTDCFSDNFIDLANVYKLQKLIDETFYKYNPLGFEDKDREEYIIFGLYEPARWLYNLGTKAYNYITFFNAIYDGISKKYKPEEHKKLIANVVEIIYNAWINRETPLDE